MDFEDPAALLDLFCGFNSEVRREGGRGATDWLRPTRSPEARPLGPRLEGQCCSAAIPAAREDLSAQCFSALL